MCIYALEKFFVVILTLYLFYYVRINSKLREKYCGVVMVNELIMLFLMTAVLLVLILAVMVYRSRVQRQHALQLSQAQKMESLGRLAGGVAHDFNNMLAGIQGAAEFIKLNMENKESDKFGKYVELIIKACLRASHLTSQLLVFAKEKERKFEPLDANELIRDGILLLEHGVSKKVEIVTSLKARVSCVEADRDLLQNMLLNLGFNARDAMPDGGKLRIATKNIMIKDDDVQDYLIKVKSGKYVELSVKDNGKGIAPENIHKIFEPFFTTKAIGKGTGLGLAAVYGIVQEHHGTIKVISSPKGTEFKICFPVSKAKYCNEKEVVIPQKINAKILIVDDEKILAELLKDILQSLGCEVVSFSVPEEALEYYSHNRDFDVVMLDVLMPHWSGVELYEKMKKIMPNLKAVFMSGYSKDIEVEKIVEENLSTAFIRKPYSAADLSEKLRGLL